MNNQTLELLKFRARFFDAVREYFVDHQFLEVMTPVLIGHCEYDVQNPQFQSQVVDKDGHEAGTAYLIISPEYQMKAILSECPAPIFQITHFFRNGNFSPLHTPEFFGVEWYEMGVDYWQSMGRTEALLRYLLEALDRDRWVYRDQVVRGDSTWRKVDISNALCRLLDADLEEILTTEKIRARMQACGYYPTEEEMQRSPKRLITWEDHFDFCVERMIDQGVSHDAPTFLINFPSQHEYGEMGQKLKEDDRKVQRFELYICGVELCNGHTELTDEEEMRRRFLTIKEQMLPEKAVDLYPDLHKISAALPTCSGCAVGLDRLLMLMLGARSLREILPPSVESDLPRLATPR